MAVDPKYYPEITRLKIKGHSLRECAQIVGIPYDRNVFLGIAHRTEIAWADDARDLEICQSLDDGVAVSVLTQKHKVSARRIYNLRKELEKLDAV